MLRTSLYLAMASFVMLGFSSAKALTFNTEEYPPFNYLNDQGEIDGVSTKVLEEVLQRSGLDADFYMLPWARGLNQAKTQDGYCIYSTTRTEEREPHFKWVGPLVSNNWSIFVMADSDLSVTSLDDLKDLRVGGYIGDATTEYLKSQGIDVQEASEDALNAKKLANDRIDVWTGSSVSVPIMAKNAGVGEVKNIFSFKETVMSLACNKSISDETISKLQTALDEMVADGSYQTLTE